MAYPATLPSFTPVVNGVDYPDAPDINDLQTAIVAIATELGTDPAGTLTDVKTRLLVSLAADGDLTLKLGSALTLSGGVITVTNNRHAVAVQTGTTDDVDTINGYADGYFLVLTQSDSAKEIVLKNGTGNIYCVGGDDIHLNAAADFALLIYSSALSGWRAMYGGVKRHAYPTKTTTYTMTLSDEDILCDATSAAFTVNLEAAATAAGIKHNIKKIDSSLNAVTIDANSSELIDGQLTQALSSQWDNITVKSNGSAWYIL